MKLLLLALALCAGLMAQDQMATIHVYRPNAKIWGIGSHPSIYYDGKELTRLHRGSVFTANVAPGKHVITGGRSEVGQFVDLEPGKAYYLRFSFNVGRHMSGNEPFTLTLVPEDQALTEMQGLK